MGHPPLYLKGQNSCRAFHTDPRPAAGCFPPVLTFLPPAPTLAHGIGTDAATFRHEERTMRGRLLITISNTVDRRKPRAASVDGSSVPRWIVPHP